MSGKLALFGGRPITRSEINIAIDNIRDFNRSWSGIPLWDLFFINSDQEGR